MALVGALRPRLDLVISQLATYVVSTASDGEIRFATGDAVERIEGYLGHERRPGRLPRELETWRADQLDHYAGNGHARARSEPFIREADGKRLIIRHVVDEDGSLLLVEEQPLCIESGALRCLGLTEREAEVLSLVAMGKTNADVSAALELSVRTVEKHLEHVYAKLGIVNRSAAVAFVLTQSRAT